MMSPVQQQYLDAMGITVWQRRTPPLSKSAESGSATIPVNQSERPVEHISPPALIDVVHMTWPELERAVADCQRCSLCEERKKSVLGEGSPQAEIMFVAAMPDATEEQSGRPIAGAAGALFNAMLQSIGLNRQEVYITHLNKCRSPNDRSASSEERMLCDTYLQRQIALLQPTVIVLLGDSVAQALLKTEQSLHELRNSLHYFGDQRIPLLVSYHPSSLINHGIEKRQAWHDLMQIKQWLTKAQET